MNFTTKNTKDLRRFDSSSCFVLFVPFVVKNRKSKKESL